MTGDRIDLGVGKRAINIEVNHRPFRAYEGETVAAALLASGINVSKMFKHHESVLS